jgi:putative addiction module component (TIGR02574 family)
MLDVGSHSLQFWKSVTPGTILRLQNMTQKIPNPPPGFDELSVDEKLDYVQSLWDHIAANPEAISVPDWHLQVIEERIKESQFNARAGRSWDEFCEELRARLSERKPGR